MFRIAATFILFFLFSPRLFSQQTGTIEGAVIDSSNNSPLAFASVSIINVADNKPAAGDNTDEAGKFLIENIPFGNYKIEITYIGYNTLVIPGIKLNAQNSQIKLGNIKLKSGATTTEEIDVKGEKSMIEFKGDKRILNVSENLILKGATALDVLKEMPGVTVDMDGNVSVRGSEGVKIMIDGKPFGLEGANRTTTLEQLSADQIDRVELSTNPSVKYDAEGSSGVINIILKKKRDYGYNGSLSLNAGSNDKYSGGININLRKDKMNLNGSYNYLKMNFNGSNNNQKTYFSDNGDYSTYQDGSGYRRRESHNFKGGIDYSISKFSNLGFLINYRDGNAANDGTTHNTEINSLNTITSDSYRMTNSNSRGSNFDFALNFSHRFKNPEHKLTSDFTFSNEPEDEISYANDEDILPYNQFPDLIKEVENDKDKNLQLSVDYELPLNKESKFEAGYKGVLKKSDNDFISSNFNYSSNQYEENDLLSNRFKYDEFVNGIYASLTGKVLNFSYLLGGRLEQTNTTGDLVTTGYNFDRSYLEFFPSVSISRKIGKTQELQVSYSKRIRRPRQENLNPFIEQDDRYNLSTGNPNLLPEFTNSFELNYINYLNIGTITPSIFFRRTTDQITRVRKLIDSVTTLTTFENLNSSNTYGAEVLISTQPLDFFGLNGNISYYKTDVTGGNLSDGISNSAYSWSTRLSGNVSLPSDFGLQVSYLYTGKRVSAQGVFNPMQTLDAAVKKDFLNKNLTLTLRMGDILNSAKFSFNLNDPEFTETAQRVRDSRSIFLDLSYKFGTDEKKKTKRSRDDKGRDNDSDKDSDF